MTEKTGKDIELLEVWFHLKMKLQARRWLMPVILATQEAEIWTVA
jgi:hypothetical protein